MKYPDEMTLVAKIIKAAVIPHHDEKAIQDGIERLLTEAGLPFVREYRIGNGAVDFRTATGGIGIECKVDGGPSAVLSQLMRYAESPDIHGLILATTRPTHRWPTSVMRDKPFGVVRVHGPLM